MHFFWASYLESSLNDSLAFYNRIDKKQFIILLSINMQFSYLRNHWLAPLAGTDLSLPLSRTM